MFYEYVVQGLVQSTAIFTIFEGFLPHSHNSVQTFLIGEVFEMF